eukprot:symbB.v1.2.024573.t1/scaffold2273.1/size83577/4
MAGSPMHPEGRGGHVVADKERDVLERRQRRLKRLRAEKDELHSALQESRRRVRQLEAAQLLFALPEVPRPELTELSDLSPASASEELPGLMDQVEPQGPPPAAQNLLRWRQLRQILQSHQETLEHEEAMLQHTLEALAERGQSTLIFRALEFLSRDGRVRLDARKYVVGISSCSRSKMWQHACCLFASMPGATALPNVFAYNAVISACEKSQEWQQALSLFQSMALAFVRPTVVSFSAAMTSCQRSGQWQQAIGFFKGIFRASLQPDVTSFNAVMSSCEKCGEWKQALAFLNNIVQARLQPDLFSYSAAVSACEKAELWEEALCLFGDMLIAQILPDVVAFSAAISACENVGKWQQALELFSLMPGMEVQPNIFTFSAAISCCDKGGQWQLALSFSTAMENARVQANVISLNAIISSCAKGEQWPLALLLLQAMPQTKVSPDVISFNAAITSCEKGGQWQLALALIEAMMDAWIQPNDISFSAAISSSEKGEDAKQLKLRCGEAEEMHRQTEGRMQHLMDLMVALLSPGRTQENQQEMVNSRYLAMIEDLETYCESMTERIAGFQGALEGERGENCCRALQLCDQQRRTTRLHETLCKLQSELFWTRPGSVLRPAGTGPREFCQVDTGAESTQAGEAMRPLALSKSLRDDSAEESAAERDVASSTDATFVHAVPATDEVLEVLSPKRTVTPRTPTPRERMENFMREILEELHFEHLVVRNSSGYAFGPCGRAQLRLEGEEVMASKDGVVYQPFKDFILQLQEQEHASVRPGPDESRNGSQHGAIQHKKTGSEARSCRPGASAVERVQNAGATSKQDIATVTGGSSAPALLNGQVARVVPQQEVIVTTPRGDLPRSKVDKKGVYLDASIVSARTVGFVPPVVHSPVVVARRCCWQTNTAQITLCNGQFPQLPLHKR